MKFRIVRVKDKMTVEKRKRISSIYVSCSNMTKSIVAIQNNLNNIENGIDKSLSIETYRRTSLDEIKLLRSTLDKIERNLNEL